MNEDLPANVKYWMTASTKHDCFFLFGDKRIGALKIFLSGHSEALKKMLEESAIAEKGEISLPDIKPEAFKNFLKCIYGASEVVIKNLSLEDAMDLLYVTDKYLVNEIKPKVISHIKTRITSSFDNMYIALLNPLCLLEGLFDSVLPNIKFTTKTLFLDPRFLQLSSEVLLRIVQHHVLSVPEITVWEALLKWAKHTTNSNNGKVLREKLLKHLRFIRFITFTLEEFCKSVVPTDILTSEEVCEICKAIAGVESKKLEHICNIRQVRNKPVYINCDEQPEIVNTFVTHISTLKNNHFDESNMFITHHFSWKIGVEIDSDQNALGMYIYCKGPRVALHPVWSFWKCKANVEIVLVRRAGKFSVRKFISCHLNKDETSCGIDYVCSWNRLLHFYNKKFVKNDKMILITYMTETYSEIR